MQPLRRWCASGVCGTTRRKERRLSQISRLLLGMLLLRRRRFDVACPAVTRALRARDPGRRVWTGIVAAACSIVVAHEYASYHLRLLLLPRLCQSTDRSSGLVRLGAKIVSFGGAAAAACLLACVLA